MLAAQACKGLGVELVDYGGAGTPLAVTGFGAGIVMAFADHLRCEYPDQRLWVGELPGGIGFEARCMVLDYLTSALPTVLLLWSSLRPLGNYAEWLCGRDWRPVQAWAYLKGVGADSTAIWQSRGVTLIEDLWQPAPLGSRIPTQPLLREAGVRGECETVQRRPDESIRRSGIGS